VGERLAANPRASGSTLATVESRYLCRRWDEARGDEFDGWGHSVWYFEVHDGGYPIRQIEVYDDGPVLRYGPGHQEDRYGCLGYASLDDAEEDWSRFVITREAFERVWNSAG
jgi:hypothetical protein